MFKLFSRKTAPVKKLDLISNSQYKSAEGMFTFRGVNSLKVLSDIAEHGSSRDRVMVLLAMTYQDDEAGRKKAEAKAEKWNDKQVNEFLNQVKLIASRRGII